MSKKCSFIKTPDDLKAINKGLSKITTHGTETLNLFWNTDIKILEKILPPQLKPASSMVIVYVCHIPYISLGTPYSEAGIIIPVLYNNESYNYMLDVVLSNNQDMAMLIGREILEKQKKLAEKITLHRNGDTVTVSVKRNGINFFNATAEIVTSNINTNNLTTNSSSINQPSISKGLTLTCNFKYNCNRLLFNNIELQEYEQETILASTEKAIITDINLTPSLDNPWSELKVIEPLGAQYQITSESYEYPPTTLEKLYGPEYYKYLLGRYDSSQMGYPYRNFND